MNKPTDEAIDGALAALRDIQPDDGGLPGMQARILHSLRQRETLARSPRNVPWFWISAGGFASAILLVAAILFHSPAPSPEQTANRKPDPTPNPRSVSSGTLAWKQPPPPAARRVPAHAFGASAQPKPAEQASFPAPEAPLTEQERLLLRIAHRGDRQDFHLLNPETVDRELAENMADFDRFFPPPAPISPETSAPPTPTTLNPALPTKENPDAAHPLDR